MKKRLHFPLFFIRNQEKSLFLKCVPKKPGLFHCEITSGKTSLLCCNGISYGYFWGIFSSQVHKIRMYTYKHRFYKVQIRMLSLDASLLTFQEYHRIFNKKHTALFTRGT